jgi:hypothetical protein
MKNLFLIWFCIINGITNAQGPGDPFFAETANGARDIPYLSHYLRWHNPSGTIYNEIYLSYDSSLVAAMDPSVLIASGFPSTPIDSLVIQNLYRVTRHYWRVVEYSSSGFTAGPIWYFITGSHQFEGRYVYDDFFNGLGRWTISNSIGTCGWQISNSANTLPPPSYGNFLTASNSICSGIFYTTAEFQQINNLTNFYEGKLEFDCDWNAFSTGDAAFVEISTDQGVTWNTIWSRVGVSVRNQHIVLQGAFVNHNWTIDNCRLRFRTLHNGGPSWWSIDNVVFYFWSGVLTPPYTSGLHTNVFDNGRKVSLTWSQVVSLPGAAIERKSGIPSDTSSYQLIGVITNGSIGYVDSTVMDSSVYTYRVWGDRYTNESTAYVFYPIPVELISFTSRVEDNNVSLIWITASEINNSGFEIERSHTSTSLSMTKWEKIGFIEGKGTITEQQFYSFTDKNLAAGKYQYRLKQIDFDGSFDYSEIVEIEVGVPDEFSLSQNYPNPFNPTTSIEYRIGNIEKVSLKVYDMLGRKVATLVNEIKEPGIYEVKFDSGNLSSGIYYYTLEAGNFRDIKKSILLK